MTQRADPLEEISGVYRDVDAAREAVRMGATVDLAPLARRAEALCISLTELPRQQAHPLAEQLTPLITALDELADDVAAKRDDLKRRLDTLSPPEPNAG